MPLMWKKYRLRGFTLIEMLLSIALMAVLVGIGAPIYARSQTKNDLDTSVQIWVESLRRAAILSAGVEGDSTWGASFTTGTITLFRGASFASRDSSYDELFAIPTTISASGLTEVVMSKLTGYPTTTGTTTIGSSAVSDAAGVTINSKGMVSW